MENETDFKNDFIEKLKSFINKFKKTIIGFSTILILILAGYSYTNYSNKKKNENMSELFIKAGIFLSKKDNIKSAELYKKIIISKNKFYAPLSLNYVIDNELGNDNEILQLFEYVEKIKMDKEQKNLIKIKKALFLIKIDKTKAGNKLLQEIISDNSVWKEAVKDILK